jgi:ABC-type spermidine/putrescine transport system permease subunit II
VSGPRNPSRLARGALWGYAALIYTFLYAPVFMVTILSFNDSEVVGLPLRGFTAEWFWVVFTRADLVTPMVNSLLLGIATATIGTTLAMLLAMAFRRPFPGNNVLFYFIIAPIVVPGVVSGVILLIFFGLIGIRPSLWTTVLAAHVTWVLPFAFLSLYSRLHQFDQSLEEAAADLGAPRWMIFRRIVFPLISPGVVAAFLFAFSLSFDEFVRTLFLTAFDRTLPVQFWYMVIESLSPEAPALAVVIIVVSVAASAAGTIIASRGAPASKGSES